MKGIVISPSQESDVPVLSALPLYSSEIKLWEAGGPARLPTPTMSTSTQLPATLLEWKLYSQTCPRNLWNPLEGFFRSQGLTLWVLHNDPSTYPADRKHRTPDSFAYSIPATLHKVPYFDQIVCCFFSPDTCNELSVLEKYPLCCNY